MMGAEQHGGHDAGADEQCAERNPLSVVAESGDEHEQHTARHQGLGACERAERERVGEHHRDRQPDGREHVPSATVDDGRDGHAELFAHQVEFGVEERPGVARGQTP